MPYSVKEAYLTLQGEGFHTGRAAVFVRFSGCNLWSGREQDRAKAICQFCDTDFVGTDGPNGGKYTADELATLVKSLWEDRAGALFSVTPFVVLTGGEPALQWEPALRKAFIGISAKVAMETNGTTRLAADVDWITVSPKASAPLYAGIHGDELKLVFPQKGLEPDSPVIRVLLKSRSFRHYYLQPMDGPDVADNTAKAIDYCLENPLWRLSTQTHKLLGIA